MKITNVAVILWLFASALHSLAADNAKLSSYVKQLAAKPRPSTARSQTPSAVEPRMLTAFLQIDAADADEVCGRFGCQVYARKGDILIVTIPISSLGALSECPSVHRIEASPSASLTMDTTAVVVGADKLHVPALPLSGHPFSGQGVIIGVMDVGFDLTHPNFYDRAAARYRIGAFWDQLSRDTVGSPLPVGRDFTGTDIVRAQLHSTDGLIQTHGTHTLGIAAGSGYQSPYQGIAFDADLCLVSNAVSDDIALIDSADYYKYTSATDALGFKYIFDYADRQGKPCVASFSEGYPPYLDEEDYLYAAFLDSLTAVPGHILVASAGNESIAKTYMEKPRGTETAGAFIQTNHESALYRLKADGPFCLSVYAYSGNTPSCVSQFNTDTVALDTVVNDTLTIGDATCIVTFDCYLSPFDALPVYNIQLTADKPLSQLPHMALVIEGINSHVELFGSSSYALTSRQTDPRWDAAQVGRNIHAPACFPSVICVGSTAHRLGFTNYKGEYCNYSSGRTVGMRSPYSSVGPTMAGVLKPDVVAPGDNIISSYSSYYLEANPSAGDINSDVEHFQFENRTYAWNANTGTSMACPVVAGTIALWLQAKPDLTVQEVKDALAHTSRQPAPSLTYPNGEYGSGEIDAYGGLLYLLGLDNIEAISSRQPNSLRLTVRNGQLTLHTDPLPSVPLNVSIYNMQGMRACQITVPPTVSQVSLPPLAAGVYAVQVDCSHPDYCGSQLVAVQ